MGQQKNLEGQDIFIGEGEKVVVRLLQSHIPIVSMLVPPGWIKSVEHLLHMRPEDITVFIAEKQVLEQLTGYSFYQGILAVAKTPSGISLEQLIQGSPRPLFFASADGIGNAENMGALIRNCAAFGAHGLILAKNCCDPYLRRSVRSSMGTIFNLPIVRASHLPSIIETLRSHGVVCVAAHPHGASKSIHDAQLFKDLCIVFGSEGHGLSDAVIAACDESVSIPMCNQVDSLNVGSATAVFLNEAQRQRTMAIQVPTQP